MKFHLKSALRQVLQKFVKSSALTHVICLLERRRSSRWIHFPTLTVTKYPKYIASFEPFLRF